MIVLIMVMLAAAVTITGAVVVVVQMHARDARIESMRRNYEAVHNSPAWQAVDYAQVRGRAPEPSGWDGQNAVTEEFIRELDAKLGNSQPVAVAAPATADCEVDAVASCGFDEWLEVSGWRMSPSDGITR